MKELKYDNFFEDLFDFRRDFDQIFNRILTVKPWDEAGNSPLDRSHLHPGH